MQIGPFTIERELGRGGMGAVYLGRSSPGAPPVAIKVVHTALSWDPDVEARFQAEGDALEALNHPNLVRLRSRGRGPGGHWIAMDYVEGQSLGAHLKAQGPWSSEAARELMIGLCAGIAHAHYEGVLHRDLKPENVILRAPNLHPLIVDFGLARPLDLSQHLTATGEILGSPGYLAPEQCGAGGVPTPATDVYGLGAVLYTALTGEPPFRGTTLLGTLDMVLGAAPRPPRELRPGVDPWLEAICLRCLSKDPQDRFPDASSLADALQARAGVPLARRRPGRTVAVVAALALLGGGVWLGWPGSQGEPEPGASAAPRASLEPAPPLWQRGPWGAKHLVLADRADAEALRGRYGLISREADEIEVREEAWTARRARAIAIARGKADSDEGAAAWVRTVAVDDFYGDSLDETEVLVAARDRARGLVQEGALAGRGGPRLEEALARLELKAWRRLSTAEQKVNRGRVIGAWARLSREEDAWWREAVRVEVLAQFEPVKALRSLQAIERSAGSPSTQAWVEFLRARFLRVHGAPPSEYLGLLETVEKWQGASPTLRAMAGLLRGAQLELGRDPRARAALERVNLEALSPRRRFGPRLRLARLSLRAGERAQSEELLVNLPAGLDPEFGFPVVLLRAELRAREGKLEEAGRALLQIPRPASREQEARLLYLRAVLGQVEHAESLAGSLSARGIGGVFEADRVLQRAALDPLWETHAGPEVKRLAERVRRRLTGSEPTREVLEGLLGQGRWQELISLTRATLADKAPRRYASLVGHALVAAEELDVPNVEIARAAREAAKAIRGVSPRKAQARSLLGAIALRQTRASPSEAQARRIATYSDTLIQAQSEDLGWSMAPAELIRLYAWAGTAHPEFRGLGHPVARMWLAGSARSVVALTAVCRFERTPERFAQLNTAVKDAPLSSDRVRAILALRRWRRDVSAEGAPLYEFLHEPAIRSALRRELHLEDARRELAVPGKESAEAALHILERLPRWCPPPEPDVEFELLVARANVQAGRLKAAAESLERVREIKALDGAEIAELFALEAMRLKLLERPEPMVKTKLLASVASGVTAATSLDYARVVVGLGEGAASAPFFSQALGYQRPIAEVEQVLAEAERAGADPLLVLEAGMRGLALRASAAQAFEVLLKGTGDLEESERLQELRAVGLVRLSRARLERGLSLPEEEGAAFMKGPWAKRARLLLEIHQVRGAAWAPGGERERARLLELEKALALEARGVSQETGARWALRWELGQIAMDLARAASGKQEGLSHARRAEALLSDAEKLGKPELGRTMQRASVIGELLGQQARAAEVLGEAVRRAKREHQTEYAGVLARARAIFLFNLGRFEEALSALKVAIESGLEPTLRGEAYLQQALCLERLGREGVLPSLRRARVSTPIFQLNTILEAKTLEARWGSKSVQAARRNLEVVEQTLSRLEPGPRAMIRGMIRVAEAELWRREGKLERALEVLDQAMAAEHLPPGAVDERLACDQALGAKGRADLLEWGPSLRGNPSLLPYEAERVRVALERAD